jgi:dTDP-4-amino-4,6-dideoxygalactose transaminase
MAVLPKEADYAESVYHLYVIRINARDKLRDYLQDKGISTGIHYPIPIHLQPAYCDLGYKKGDFPITEEYAGQILSLPMYAELTPVAIESVAEAIRDFETEFRLEDQISIVDSITTSREVNELSE